MPLDAHWKCHPTDRDSRDSLRYRGWRVVAACFHRGGVLLRGSASAASFGMLVGLSTAIGQFTCVVVPGLIGLMRDLSGGYGTAFALCIVLELVATAVILWRPAARKA